MPEKISVFFFGGGGVVCIQCISGKRHMEVNCTGDAYLITTKAERVGVTTVEFISSDVSLHLQHSCRFVFGTSSHRERQRIPKGQTDTLSKLPNNYKMPHDFFPPPVETARTVSAEDVHVTFFF